LNGHQKEMLVPGTGAVGNLHFNTPFLNKTLTLNHRGFVGHYTRGFDTRGTASAQQKAQTQAHCNCLFHRKKIQST
jgi:hypothetical protein